MKKLISGAIAASVLSLAGTAVVADTEALVYDVIFDGFCDGISGTFRDDGVVVGVYASSCATCPFPDRMGGAGGSLKGQGKALSIGWETGPTFIHHIIRKDGTWTHYNFDGSVLNAGTWTSCVAVTGDEIGDSASTD